MTGDYLNRIFHGPPGTGKTHLVVREALALLGITAFSEGGLHDIRMSMDNFYDIHRNFLTDNKFKPGKKPYRNMYSINALMALYMKRNSTSLSKRDIISETGWDGPSSYVQQERILTNFDLSAEGWDDAHRDRLSLNAAGQDLLDDYKTRYATHDAVPDTELPDFAIAYFVGSLKNTTAASMTLWKNIIICSLRLAYSEGFIFTFKGIGTVPTGSHGSKMSAEEKDILKKYYNYEGDLTFLDWAVAYLQNLKLVEDAGETDKIVKYRLTSEGRDLVRELKIAREAAVAQTDEPDNNDDAGSETMRLLKKKRQLILYGPPGTGKTFDTRSLAIALVEEEKA